MGTQLSIQSAITRNSAAVASRFKLLQRQQINATFLAV
jgi:hypothetical protein